jgi:predicted dithiol-disulfide oxidoreductase (DUF899 family)
VSSAGSRFNFDYHVTVYHTYSAYARGCGALWGMWQWLDRAPSGRIEGDMSTATTNTGDSLRTAMINRDPA